jgi:hypothetical protein
MNTDSNRRHRFEPQHIAAHKGLPQFHAHCRSSNFGETMIAHVLVVVRRFIDVLVI